MNDISLDLINDWILDKFFEIKEKYNNYLLDKTDLSVSKWEINKSVNLII